MPLLCRCLKQAQPAEPTGIGAWLSLTKWKANSYADSLPGSIAGYCNVSPVRFDYGPGDGQSQTGAAYSPFAGLAGTVEAVEEVGQVGGGDANPVIGDGDGQCPIAGWPKP